MLPPVASEYIGEAFTEVFILPTFDTATYGQVKYVNLATLDVQRDRVSAYHRHEVGAHPIELRDDGYGTGPHT